VSCCSGGGCGDIFTKRVADRDARRYRRKGLDKTARRMVEFLVERGVDGLTVLEVGGGVGAIQLELLTQARLNEPQAASGDTPELNVILAERLRPVAGADSGGGG